MQNPKIVFFDIDDTIYRKYTDTLRPSIGEAAGRSARQSTAPD